MYSTNHASEKNYILTLKLNLIDFKLIFIYKQNQRYLY